VLIVSRPLLKKFALFFNVSSAGLVINPLFDWTWNPSRVMGLGLPVIPPNSD
jgi:hypothetical protein